MVSVKRHDAAQAVLGTGFFVVVLLIGIYGAGPTTSNPCEAGEVQPSGCPGAASRASSLSSADLERAILCLINQARSASALARLRLNARLHNAADAYSKAMVAGGFFSHRSPGGTTFVQRIAATGYLRKADGWLVGETIVWGTQELSTPESLLAAWLASPPHRANVLRKRFRQLGVGAVLGTPKCATETEGTTVTAEFGYRRLE